MTLLIDNYDSFSYNLFQLVGSLDPSIKVVRNDAYTAAELFAMNPSRVILSPGPGWPRESGVCMDILRFAPQNLPILGVCLGHQAICEVFGTPVSYASEQMHGKQSEVIVDIENPLFRGLPEVIRAARYHSLAADKAKVSPVLRVIGRTDNGEVMAVCHASRPIYGVQFHPESILTPMGKIIIENFLKMRAP